MSARIPTVVVSAFPCLGKTTAAARFPRLFRDLEYSDYHWIIDETGSKTKNPLWPQNYIEAIKNLSTSGMYKTVFVSSHDEIRKAMKEAGVKYTNVFPQDTPEMKRVYMERLKARDPKSPLVPLLDENYSSFIENMREDTGAVAALQVTPEALNKWTEWCAYV